jgi:hypothetical protein
MYPHARACDASQGGLAGSPGIIRAPVKGHGDGLVSLCLL